MRTIEKKQKKKKWCKFRHRVVTAIARFVLTPFIKWKYHCSVKPFREAKKRPFLILFNHQTAFDQFFVGKAFQGPVYYIASEDIFSNGIVSSLIRYLVAPIPIKKQTTDVQAILNCLRIAKEGGTIALAPEGNRTYSGKTGYISPSIVPLAKKLKMPIALFRIEGGYGVQPRWSDVVRKGKMQAYVSRVLEPEEYAAMSDDELFAVISRELYVDEGVADGEFRHKKSAEYLERAVYTCPDCGLTEWESNGDLLECKTCHRRVRYLPTKELCGVESHFPFRFVGEWYDYQTKLLAELDFSKYTAAPLYRERVALFEVIPYHKKQKISKDATISLYGDRITLEYGEECKTYTFDALSAVTVLGKNKLNLYFEGRIFQIKGSKRFNALKYVHFYHQDQNNKKGVTYGFLGI